jgi:cytochrome c556
MKKCFLTIGAAAGLAFAAVAAAAQPSDHKATHMTPHAPDVRRQLDFPPPMRDHMLSNMRSHLEAISEIIEALSVSDGEKAAKIAQERLSLESPHAAACKPENATKGDAGHDMARMMAHHMPEEMRAMGYSMHESAGQLAIEAAKLKAGGDPKPALAALAKVTQNCAACHSAYRLR